MFTVYTKMELCWNNLDFKAKSTHTLFTPSLQFNKIDDKLILNNSNKKIVKYKQSIEMKYHYDQRNVAGICISISGV